MRQPIGNIRMVMIFLLMSCAAGWLISHRCTLRMQRCVLWAAVRLSIILVENVSEA
jgi:hypothetical protein